MFLHYDLSGFVSKLFNIQFGTKKGNVPTPDIRVDDKYSIKEPSIKHLIETTVAIRQNNEAVKIILDSIEIAKENNQSNPDMYYEEKTIDDFGKTYFKLAKNIDELIYSVIRNSKFKDKVISHNRENPKQRYSCKPIVIISPVIDQMLHFSNIGFMVGFMGYDTQVTLDVRVRNKIIVLLSVKHLDFDVIETDFNNMNFGDLYIEDEVIEGNKIIPHYKFNVNNYIFGVINFEEDIILDAYKKSIE